MEKLGQKEESNEENMISLNSKSQIQTTSTIKKMNLQFKSVQTKIKSSAINYRTNTNTAAIMNTSDQILAQKVQNRQLLETIREKNCQKLHQRERERRIEYLRLEKFRLLRLHD